ncbi:expressed unknown protein [Seminavis robusta]|uniref:Ubiquitin-like domain-containing protein n=1 Tax=Seminavis robusta TaxID=568900 RepID=A0A9N8H256_9STRA|nr:expressed unknown protein [Seminavis robusta]CAB9531619.1 expressed unknown protein [Seminavis robusta]|eukprot:Sro3742_g350780.1 n/a (114) ;mRNA; f:4156-4497
MFNQPEETFEDLNSSIASLDLNDLPKPAEAERKLSGIRRGVFVAYGMKSLNFFVDVNESLAEVQRTVEARTGIPMDNQVLEWENTGVLIDGNKSLRDYGMMSGGFCALSSKDA